MVVTGGIGETAPQLRQRICADLGYLGVTLDPDRNRRQDRTISAPESPVVVNAVPTNEALIIARHTYRLGIAEHGQLRTVGRRSRS